MCSEPGVPGDPPLRLPAGTGSQGLSVALAHLTRVSVSPKSPNIDPWSRGAAQFLLHSTPSFLVASLLLSSCCDAGPRSSRAAERMKCYR